MGLMVWLTKRLLFLDLSNVVGYFIPKSCYFCERSLPSVASNKVVIFKPQLVTFNCFPFDLDVKLLKCTKKFIQPRFSKSRQIYIGYIGCLHDTRATFAPTKVHSGSISWFCICLHDYVMPARVTPAWVNPGCCTRTRIPLRYEISQRYHVNA